eukprot:scaffold146015_cov14-Tisochrysis_lutea.AAC.1
MDSLSLKRANKPWPSNHAGRIPVWWMARLNRESGSLGMDTPGIESLQFADALCYGRAYWITSMLIKKSG